MFTLKGKIRNLLFRANIPTISNLGAEYWHRIIRVLKYLQFTHIYGLHNTRYPSVLEGYSDANWISDSDESKSTSDYVFNFGGGAVT